MCLLTISMSSLEKCLLSFLLIYDWVVCFLILSCMTSLYNLEISPLLVASFVIFSPIPQVSLLCPYS